MAARRVEVYLAIGQETRQARFDESVVDTLGDGISHIVCVCASFADSRLTLCSAPEIHSEKQERTVLARPSCCPLHEMAHQTTAASESSLPALAVGRSVAMAAAVLLESADEMVLLTQRALSMRTFPGLWVVPGGHVECGETLEMAGLRELAEETGIKLSKEQVKVKRLCLWESTYPPLLSRGCPRRHHIIAYIHITSTLLRCQLHEQLALCPEEVAAASWLCKDEVKTITQNSTGSNVDGQFRVYEQSSSGLNSALRPLTLLLAQPPTDSTAVDCERLSSGSRFALQQWLLSTD